MTATDILAEYRRLAERLTLSDGSRPLMKECPYGSPEEHQETLRRSPRAVCRHCDMTGYVPRLDLRDSQPAVPLDLVLEALKKSELFGTLFWEDSMWSLELNDAGLLESTNIVAVVLAAANAALDAREGKK